MAKNQNLQLIGTKQELLEVKGHGIEAQVFEIDLKAFLKAEKKKEKDFKIKRLGKEEYFDTF